MASKTQMGVRLNMTLLYLIRRLVTGGNLTRCERCMASFGKMHFSLLCLQHVALLVTVPCVKNDHAVMVVNFLTLYFGKN